MPRRGPSPPGNAVATPAVTPAQREAARRLGAVYRLARFYGARIDHRAIPTARRDGALDHGLLAALGDVHGSDGWRAGPGNRYALYKADYDAVMPQVERALATWLRTTAEAEAGQLATLRADLAGEGAAARLSRAARALAAACGGFEPTPAEIAAAYPRPQVRSWVATAWDLDLGRSVHVYGTPSGEQRLQRLVRTRVGRHVDARAEPVLATLFLHPRGVTIVDEYRGDPTRGTNYAQRLVARAAAAAEELWRRVRADAVAAWRHPVLLEGAIALLGLQELRGFGEYVRALGLVRGSSRVEEALGFAGATLVVLGLVFSGPLAFVVLGAADLALAGTGTVLAALREREQEVLADASSFRARQLAEPTAYGDTALAAAGALLSGLGLTAAVREYRAVARERGSASVSEALERRLASEPPEARPRAPDAADVADRATDARGLDRVARETTEARATAPAPGQRARLDRFGEAGIRDARAQRGAATAPPTQRPAPSAAAGSSERPVLDRRSDTVTSTTAGLEQRATGDPVARTTTPKQRRQAERDALAADLDARIAARSAVIDELNAEQKVHENELRSIVRRRAEADRAGDLWAVEQLDARRQELKEMLEEVRGKRDLDTRRRALIADRHALTKDYEKVLTAEAARTPSWRSVGAGERSELFKPALSGDPSWVEHVYPRSAIMNEEGFFALTRDQQVALLALRENMIKIPRLANLERSDRPYRELKRAFVAAHLRDEQAWRELIDLEERMRRRIQGLIRSPSTIPVP